MSNAERVVATTILSYEIAKSGIPIESGDGTFEVMGSLQRSKLYQKQLFSDNSTNQVRCAGLRRVEKPNPEKGGF